MVKVSDEVGVAAFHIAPYFSTIVPNQLIVEGIVRHAVRIRFLEKWSSRALRIFSVVRVFANVNLKILEMVFVNCMSFRGSFKHVLDD